MIPTYTELARLLFQTARPDNYITLPEEKKDAALFIGKFRCLQQLTETDGVSQRALADALRIRPASLSELLARLEQKGLVERRASETDRRSLRVFLTDRGREEQKKGVALQRQIHAAMFAALSDEEKGCLYSILKKIKDQGGKEVPLP